MPYWIFKISNQELYPDIPGEQYVYDNTHSIRIKAHDVFLYLDKRNNDYAFSATGVVEKISKRKPAAKEVRHSRVRVIYTAHLKDVIWFKTPLSISPTKSRGKDNRIRLGIVDVNLLGWSQSIPTLEESMYRSIMELAEEKQLIDTIPLTEKDYSVEDNYSVVKKRILTASFKRQVLERHCHQCIVCGTTLKAVLEAAHISPYSTDKKNRANPANGLCLCSFCHKAFDRRLIAISPTGELHISSAVTDEVALEHFSRIDARTRAVSLRGVDSAFLLKRVDELNLEKMNDI